MRILDEKKSSPYPLLFPAFLFLKGAGSAEAGPALPLFKVAGSAEAGKARKKTAFCDRLIIKLKALF